MAKRFVFDHPFQLKDMVPLCKGDSSRIVNTAKVWSVNARRNGKTPWDGKIGVSFFTEGRERKACVFRLGINEQEHVLGYLKYSPALKWCEEYLQQGQ